MGEYASARGCRSPSSQPRLVPTVDHLRGEPLEPVVGQVDRTGLGGNPEAGPPRRAARLAEPVAGEPEVAGLAPDVDAHTVLAAAVGDAVRLDPIAVRPEV